MNSEGQSGESPSSDGSKNESYSDEREAAPPATSALPKMEHYLQSQIKSQEEIFYKNKMKAEELYKVVVELKKEVERRRHSRERELREQALSAVSGRIKSIIQDRI